MAEHYVGNQLPCFRSSHPSPRGGKQIHTRQKPDSAAELEKLVLEGKAGGGGLPRPQGRCLGAVLTSQVALGLPGRRHLEVLSLGDGRLALSQGHLSNDHCRVFGVPGSHREGQSVQTVGKGRGRKGSNAK